MISADPSEKAKQTLCCCKALAQAAELFSAGEFYQTHEVLEQSWSQCRGHAKDFVGGIILCAAALHKSRVLNDRAGARRIFARAIHHLADIPDVNGGVDVRRLEQITLKAINDPTAPTLLPMVEGAPQE